MTKGLVGGSVGQWSELGGGPGSSLISCVGGLEQVTHRLRGHLVQSLRLPKGAQSLHPALPLWGLRLLKRKTGALGR